MTDRIISLAPATAAELDPPSLVSCAAQAGYTHVGLRLIQGVPAPESLVARDTTMVKEIGRRLALEGIGVLDIEVVRLDGVTDVGACRASLEAGALLGARHLVVIADDPEPERLANDYARLCELAGGFGLTVDIEPVPYYRTGRIEAAYRLIQQAGVRNGGIVVDSLHFDRAAEDLERLGDLPSEVLHYMQLCDAPAERPDSPDELMRQARQERLFPGEGGLALLPLLRALPADMPISVEVPKTALAASVGPVDRAGMALRGVREILAQL
jgi:sugar phosphate isomerase/epimerase